ncbi:uncharacterized protein B0H18DRAFT_1002694 [Fomitopsis serialis]|uniref:uncharacterized protein n=1 Tax=Fomitopsis serialis TaxID=139415 RepID=UPI0020072B7C|nr:uncharacterized protein B0H18DRAFT_1002694 [Neoantrodia serialis]KAH9927597.1 hypothetical protein B0H18DRAFT_1002694 [Neoantrodia serialis]
MRPEVHTPSNPVQAQSTHSITALPNCGRQAACAEIYAILSVLRSVDESQCESIWKHTTIRSNSYTGEGCFSRCASTPGLASHHHQAHQANFSANDRTYSSIPTRREDPRHCDDIRRFLRVEEQLGQLPPARRPCGFAHSGIPMTPVWQALLFTECSRRLRYVKYVYRAGLKAARFIDTTVVNGYEYLAAWSSSIRMYSILLCRRASLQAGAQQLIARMQYFREPASGECDAV